MMKSCPNCSRGMVNVEGTNHMRCESCNSTVFHEGNGFVIEHF